LKGFSARGEYRKGRLDELDHLTGATMGFDDLKSMFGFHMVAYCTYLSLALTLQHNGHGNVHLIDGIAVNKMSH
jgi:hypothetical protein